MRRVSQATNPPGRTENDDRNIWLQAVERRLLKPTPTAIRLIHTEGKGLHCDRFGPVCWFYWYRQNAPTDDQLQCFEEIRLSASCKHWVARRMQNRGSDPQQSESWSSPDAPSEWEVQEHGITYVMRSDRGLSPGLFLDQRRNREWMLSAAKGQRVLNLFAYTGGFGLCAAHGGAAKVTHVDISRPNLDWAAENLRRNGQNTDYCELVQVDARLFLRGCLRRQRQFDIVVCDPPSFSRGREGAFRVERDLKSLVEDSVTLLRPEGQLLVSSNYEQWTKRDFEQTVRAAAGRKCAFLPVPKPDNDFEIQGAQRILKTALVARKD